MGTPVRWGHEFLVNTTTASHQFQPTITALADCRFVVAWSDSSATGGDLSVNAVRAQMFSGDGTSSGTEFLVNTTTQSHQDAPTITALSDGGYVVAFSDQSATGGDTSSYAVRAQVFDPREAAVNSTGSALGDDFIGTAFADTMQGNAGNDHLVGKQGDDLLDGDAGHDLLFGRLGADTIAGGTGDETVTGNRGTDTFVFPSGGGQDLVTDFQDGNDVLDLTAFGFASFAAAASHFATSGADVVLTSGPNTLLIQNFTLAQLTAADLIL